MIIFVRVNPSWIAPFVGLKEHGKLMQLKVFQLQNRGGYVA